MSRPIDADALTKRLIEFCNKNCPYTAKERNVMCGSCFMGLALEAVEDAPTIEERKTGKWIIHETETDRYDDMKCPFCKKSYTVDAYRIDDIGFTAADFNFCPNCGSYNGGDKDDQR